MMSALNSLLVLGLMLYAFSLIILGPRGTRACGRIFGRFVQWLVGILLRMALVVAATMVDIVITCALAAYHTVSVRRADMVADDLAGFMLRLNDRVLQAVMH